MFIIIDAIVVHFDRRTERHLFTLLDIVTKYCRKYISVPRTTTMSIKDTTRDIETISLESSLIRLSPLALAGLAGTHINGDVVR